MEIHVKNKKQKKKKGKIIVFAAAAVFVILLFCGYFLFTVDKVEYLGSEHYNDEELNELIFGTDKPNAAAYYLFGNKNRQIPFVQKYDIDIEWPDKMTVTVYEKAVVGYISYMGCNMYFDKDGIVVESSSEEYSSVPRIDGLKFNSIVLNEKLDVGDDSVFDKILELTQAFDKYELDVSRVSFTSSYNCVLYIGDVRIELGNGDDYTDKLYALKQIQDKLTDMKGTLNLAEYDGRESSIIFKKEN